MVTLTRAWLPRPEALCGVRLDQHAVIEASAGTGKTFTLEHLVVELVVGGAAMDEILVVTFTEKATTELRLRIRAKLEGLLAGRETVPEPIGESLVIDGSARERLERALHGYDGATISTIHAFCQRVLRDNAFASGRLFEEEQVDGRDVFARVLRDVLRREIAGDAHRAPWLEAALAGGWSIARLEELLWKCLAARCELLPRFDARARESLETLLASVDTAALRSGTAVVELQRWGIHASTAKKLARCLPALADAVDRVRGSANGTPAFVAAARGLELAYLRECLPASPPGQGPLARACASVRELARCTPSLQAAIAQTMLEAVRAELSQRKRRAGQFDFDDMLALVDEGLSGPRGEALRAAMRDRWRYALIDEFQDTDETQWSIFRQAFFTPGPTKSVVFLVGDPKQSIYRFRGADVETYLHARQEVLSSGGRLIPLSRNFRSTPELIDATNALLDQEANDPFFTGAIEYEPVSCGRPARALVDGRGAKVTPLHVFEMEGRFDLAVLGTRIAAEVRRITDPSCPWRLDGRPLTHSDVFVLTRKNDEARAVGAALRGASVPYAYYKEDGLFQSDEAIEVRDLLAAIDAPEDRSRRSKAWLTRFFDLPLADVDRARDLPPSHPLLARLAAWKVLAEERAFDRLFEAIVVDSGVLRREIFFGDGERELTNYLHVFEILLEHTRQTRVTLSDLVHLLSGLIDRTRQPLDLEGNVQRLESERRAVQIMTIHKAKGLEAPVVFLAGGFSSPRYEEPRVFHANGRRCAFIGTPPADVKAQAAQEEREDEQRLMYVAVTRAMGRMYLPALASNGEPGKVRGPYESVHRRLLSLVKEQSRLVSVERVSPPLGASSPAPANDTRPDAPSPARPPVHLLGPDENRDYDLLRARHGGARVTSYTRMRSGRGPLRSASAVHELLREPPERRDEKALSEAVDAGTPAPLRSARTSGVFIHELLERVPIASFESESFEDWRSRADVAPLFDESLAIHRVDPEQRAHAERLVWRAYATPVSLPGGGSIDRIAKARRVLREMDFVFSVPGTRLFVRGSLDIAFEHDGRTYFADWKTDLRSDYSSEALEQHVLDHYGEQARLYSLAVVKLLDLDDRARYEARFGGLLYCFLRGIDGTGAGVWSTRPGWDEVEGWAGWLREQGSALDGGGK